MNARYFVRTVAVASFAICGCASTATVVSPPRTVCMPRSAPVAAQADGTTIHVRGEDIVAGERVLWPVPSDGPIDPPRVIDLEASRGYAVVVRQGDGIWVGALDEHAVPRTDLLRVGGRGRWLGAPSVLARDGDVLLAWQDGERVKLAKWETNGAPDAPRALDDLGVARFCEGGKP